MATAFKEMNDGQRKAKRVIDLATDTVIAYCAKTVPALGNLTPEGMVEDLGRLNEARKLMEKTEKILKERLKSMEGFRPEITSDNYIMTYTDVSRVALNQGKAKDYLEAQGILAEYMDETSVPTMRIKPLGA